MRTRLTPRRPPRPLLAALAVLAVCAPTLAAGPARAAEPVTVTASVSPAAVVYPDGAAVFGSVSLPGATLSLFARPAAGGDWTPAGTAVARADGAYRFDVAPPVTTDYLVAYENAGATAAQAEARLLGATAPRRLVPRKPLAGRVRGAARAGRAGAPRRHRARRPSCGRGLAVVPDRDARCGIAVRTPVDSLRSSGTIAFACAWMPTPTTLRGSHPRSRSSSTGPTRTTSPCATPTTS